MDFHFVLAKLTRHPLFLDWQKNNADYFLAHAFLLLDEANKDTWQIGFYSPTKERIITFLVSPTDVQHTTEQEVLRSEGTITKLNPADIVISPVDALKTAHECFLKNYAKEQPIKQFFIIQHIDEPIYNITYFTQSFKTINIKIHAHTGKILHHNMQALMDFT